MKNFDAMSNGRLEEVTLENGVIPLFSDDTQMVVQEMFNSILLYCHGLKPKDFKQREEEVYCLVEHYAKLGAYIASITTVDSKIYELGCGLALPLISYSLLTGRTAIGIDKNSQQIEQARNLADALEVNITLMNNNVEDVMMGEMLTRDDVVVFCGRADWLTNFQNNLNRKSGCTTVFSTLCNVGDYIEDHIQVLTSNLFQGIHPLEIGVVDKEPDRAVFVAGNN